MSNLPLTHNGKINRSGLPAPDQIQPELEKTFVSPRTEVEQVLTDVWCQVLGIEQIGIYDNFFELGGDSILSIQIIAHANQRGLLLTPKQLFQHQTIAELAAVVGAAKTGQVEQNPVVGTVPLTPIQSWFFEQNQPNPHYWNQSVLLEVVEPLDTALLAQAVCHIVGHHDALRLRFERKEVGWHQFNAAHEVKVPFTTIDLSALPEAIHSSYIENLALKIQASLDLSEGPLARMVYFDLGPNSPGRLLTVIHHLGVDGVSWRILFTDLQTAYQQLNQGKAVQLPPKTTSFKYWAEQLTEYAQSEEARKGLTYWLTRPWDKVKPLPVDSPTSIETNTVGSLCTVEVSLNSEETQVLLHNIPTIYQTRINDVLLTALVLTFARHTGSNVLLFDLDGHGREDIIEGVDLSRTVGWFTSLFPVLLEIEENQNAVDTLLSVKTQLDQIQNRGISYGLMRYLSNDAEITKTLVTLPKPEVSFNYMGQYINTKSSDTLFREARESRGPDRSPQGRRRTLLEVNGRVARERLQLTWDYSQNIHRQSTIEKLAQGYIEALRLLIDHCQSSDDV